MTAADQSPSTGQESTDLAGDRGVDARADLAVGVPEGAAGTDDGVGGSDAADLAAQIRELAGCDPADVQRVVSDVLAALERVAGGRLHEPLAEPGAEGGRTTDPG